MSEKKTVWIPIDIDIEFEPCMGWNCPLSFDASYDDDGWWEPDWSCNYYNNCPFEKMKEGLD